MLLGIAYLADTLTHSMAFAAQSLMGPQPGVLIGILDSIWKGWESVRLTAGSRTAAALSYQECLCHALIQVIMLP